MAERFDETDDALPKKALTRDAEEKRNEAHTEKHKECLLYMRRTDCLLSFIGVKPSKDLQIDMIVPLSFSHSLSLSPPNSSLSLLLLCLSPLSVSD